MTGHRAAAAKRSRSTRRRARCCSPRTPTPTSRSPGINDVGLDHYLMKPWDPPEQRLYPVLDDLLARVARARACRRSTGFAWWARSGRRASFAAKEFLSRNRVPYQWVDVDADAPVRALAESLAGELEPAAGGALPGRHASRRADDGRAGGEGGPADAGAAAVLRRDRHRRRTGGARERRVRRVGGTAHGARRVARAGRTGGNEFDDRELSRLPGRASPAPTSRSGRRRRRGASAPSCSRRRRSSDCAGRIRIASWCSPTAPNSPRTRVVITTGMTARMLDVPGARAAAGRRRVLRRGDDARRRATAAKDICIVGGANSAGQGALFFSRYARRVTMIVRAADLAPRMSNYLVERIRATANIDVVTGVEVECGARGERARSR